MEKIDLRRDLKHLYGPSTKRVEVVDVPEFQFLMIDGQVEAGQTVGGSPAFQAGVGALYGASYTLKFMSKLRADNPIDYPVMALEGLWWTPTAGLDITRPEGWQWTLMILQPDHITPEMLPQAIAKARKKQDNPAFDRLRLERFREGLCMQITHLGPYSEEPATVEKMKAFAEANGYRPCGRHHEIYMGDPRQAKPENLKTVLRQPIAKAE